VNVSAMEFSDEAGMHRLFMSGTLVLTFLTVTSAFVLAFSLTALVFTFLSVTSTFVLTSLGVAALMLAFLSVTSTFMLAFSLTAFMFTFLSMASTFMLASLGVTGAFVFSRFSLAATLGFATAASRQFGTGLSVGLHIVSIITELADTFADGIGSRLFRIIGHRKLGSGHIIGAGLHALKRRNSRLHNLGTAATLAVGLDSYILRGLCGQSQGGHHDHQ
jgi:hypothetical protein